MKIHGLLLINKTPGGTSHDVVDCVRRIFRIKRVGHTGTLDPQAEGLMLLCLGRATRLQQYLTGLDKIYEGTIRFGYSTTTYDGEGERTSKPVDFHPDLESLHTLSREYTGTYMQTPPPYSAKRYKGKRLYELARSGEQVPHLEKEITVHDFHFSAVEGTDAKFHIHCGSGTYLRTIAHEIGQQMGCGAFLYHLKRLAIGIYHVNQAAFLKDLQGRENAAEGDHFIRLQDIHLPFPRLKMDALSGNKLLSGQKVTYYDPDFKPENREGLIQIISPSGFLLCIGKYVLNGKEMILVEPKVVVGDRCE